MAITSGLHNFQNNAFGDNYFDVLLDKIVAGTLMRFRENLVSMKLVSYDYKSQFMKKGDTVQVKRPLTRSVKDMVPRTYDPGPPTVTDTGFLEMKLDYWRGQDTYLDDLDLFNINPDEFVLPQHFEAIAQSLAEEVNASVVNEMSFFSSFVNDPGVAGPVGTLFPVNIGGGQSDMGIVGDISKLFIDNKVPMGRRSVVLDSQSYTDIMIHPAFYEVNKAGNSLTRTFGQIGQNFGYDWYVDTQIPEFDPSAGVTNGLLAADAVVGQTVVDLGIAGVIPGEVITFGTTGVRHTVYESVGATAYRIEPPIPGDSTIVQGQPPTVVHTTGTAWNASLLYRGVHTQAAAFDSRAIQLVVAPLSDSSALTNRIGGSVMTSITDPESGLSMRLELKRQENVFKFTVDILWGVQNVEPNLGTRILAPAV